jgi:putative oxidoreductase
MTTDIGVWLVALGRVLLGGLFVLGGLRHFAILPQLSQMMRARGIPLPFASIVGASVFQTVCGLLLAIGFFVTPAALGLVAFTLAAGIVVLNFWDKSGEERTAALNAWQSNLAIIGGLLIAALRGA